MPAAPRRSMRRWWRQFALACLLIAALGTAGADDGVTIDLRHDEAVGLAARWIAEGKSDQASKLLDSLEKAYPGDPQVIFLQGQLALQRGQYPIAITRFRSLLTQDPALIRVRLELARALYLAGDYEAARYHFELALGDKEISDNVRTNILRFLRAIYAQTTWLSVTATLISDSNPTNAARADRVRLFGQDFTLNPDARPQSSTGLGVWGDARYAFGSENRNFVRGQFLVREFPGSHADYYYFQGTAGKNFFEGDSVWTAEAGPAWAQYQGQHLFWGPVAEGRHAHPLGRRLIAVESVTWRRLDYADFDHLDADQVWLRGRLRYALDPTSGLWGGLAVGHSAAAEQPYSYNAAELEFRYTTELPARLNLEAGLTMSRYRYRADLPPFGMKRRDRSIRFDLNFVLRNLAFEGFAPYFGVSFEQVRSTISLHEFNRNFVAIGITREF